MIFNFDIFKLGRMKYTFIFSKVTDPILKVLGGIQYQNVMLYSKLEIIHFHYDKKEEEAKMVHLASIRLMNDTASDLG